MKRGLAWLVVVLPALAVAQGVRQSATSEMLSNAARTGDLKRIESLISAGVNLNEPNQYGCTPLSYAALFNRDQVAALLLANKADPNLRAESRSRSTECPKTPLQIAASMGNLRMASMLIAAGANVRAITRSGRTALHFAAVGSHLDMIRLLLGKGADVEARDNEGSSALDDAVWRGHLEAVAILLANGAPLNEPEAKTGATPINEAAYRNQLPLAAYLLQFHPDLHMPDKRGYTPLENAIRMGNEQVAMLLLEAVPKEQKTAGFLNKMLAASAAKNEAQITDALLRDGAEANAGLTEKAAPLDIAASAGAASVVRVLLDRGANPNGNTQNGTSPLENAALKGFAKIVTMLLDRGADVNRVNPASGTTALYAAAAFGKGEVVNLLLQHRAEPNLCGSGQTTPYKAAFDNGFNDVATEIQQHGGSNTCLKSGRP